MKLFFKKRLTFVFVFMLLLSALQLLLVYLSFDINRDFSEVRHEVLILLIVFILLQFFLFLLIIVQLPYYLKKYLNVINNLISEISQGSYNVDIDIEEHLKLRDREYVETISSIKKMLDIILRFDLLKKQKIQEQRARIIALLNLTENGFIIINKKGDIVYTNHVISEYFPTIKEDINILEASFNFDIDKSIKSYISEVIKTKSRLMPKNFFMSVSKQYITLKSEIIKDSNGEFDGTVIGIFKLAKIKNEITSEK